MKFRFAFSIILHHGHSVLPPLYRTGLLSPLKQTLIQQVIFYADQIYVHCQEKGLQTEKQNYPFPYMADEFSSLMLC